MHRFIVRDDNLESGFLSLSKQLPASITNNTLHIPQHRGSGVIKSVFLETGLYLRYFRIAYYEDIEILRQEKQPDSDIIFALSFLLTPYSPQTANPFPNPSGWKGYSNTIFLTSNNIRISVRIPERSLSQTIELLFSQKWLSSNMTGMEKKIETFTGGLVADNLISGDNGLPFLTELTRTDDENLLREIEAELNKPMSDLLLVRSRALMLLSNVFKNLPEETITKLPIRETYYIQTIRQVEQRLVRNLENRLPSQKQLAKEFALSESTLKRHFKATYGKTIYEYYLGKKMDLAKWLLKEKKMNVSETAYMLGYEKVSSFIIMFKKYHKVLPGSLRCG
ncbi:helix-turn-helix domain-containing protein [Flavitalea flava]